MSKCGMSKCGLSKCGMSKCGLSKCGVSNVECKKFKYKNIKRDLKSRTLLFGSVLSCSYLLTSGVSECASCILGVGSSYIYIDSLCKYVDNIEYNPLAYQLCAPVLNCICMSLWNTYNEEILHIDYLTTFAGFLCYKLALCEFLLEAVKIDIQNSIEENKNKNKNKSKNENT